MSLNKKDYWLECWEKNSINFHQMKINSYLHDFFFQFLTLEKSHTILVPLCGKSLDMLYLASKGHCVIGVELSGLAIVAFFEENNLTYKKTKNIYTCQEKQITLIQGDLFNLSQTDPLFQNLDRIYDRAAMVALPLELRKKYLRLLLSLVPLSQKEYFKYFLISFEYGNESTQDLGPPFSVTTSELDLISKASCFEFTLLHSTTHPTEREKFIERGVLRYSDNIYLGTFNKKGPSLGPSQSNP